MLWVQIKIERLGSTLCHLIETVIIAVGIGDLENNVESLLQILNTVGILKSLHSPSTHSPRLTHRTVEACSRVGGARLGRAPCSVRRVLTIWLHHLPAGWSQSENMTCWEAKFGADSDDGVASPSQWRHSVCASCPPRGYQCAGAGRNADQQCLEQLLPLLARDVKGHPSCHMSNAYDHWQKK